MRYNLKLAEAFQKTTIGLDGIIEALTYPPPNPKTVVTYQNGDVIEYLIEGELGQNSIPDKMNAVKVEIGTAVTSIGNSTFIDCFRLIYITIPDSVKSIGHDAFSNCSGLTSVTIPNGVTSIGPRAFFGCSGLLSVTIGNGVTSITDSVFFECFGLTSITIGNNVTNISDYAFYSCSGLMSITIPDSVTSIGDSVFSCCTALSSITSLRTTAPTVTETTFEGRLDSDYTGRNTYSSGNNVLKVPQGAIGYNTSYWLDPLQSSMKCGFHIEYE